MWASIIICYYLAEPASNLHHLNCEHITLNHHPVCLVRFQCGIIIMYPLHVDNQSMFLWLSLQCVPLPVAYHLHVGLDNLQLCQAAALQLGLSLFVEAMLYLGQDNIANRCRWLPDSSGFHRVQASGALYWDHYVQLRSLSDSDCLIQLWLLFLIDWCAIALSHVPLSLQWIKYDRV